MDEINTYFSACEQMLRTVSRLHILRVLHMCEQAYLDSRRIFIMGNGGSAATASHLALDLCKNTLIAGVPRVKAISLTDHIPLITAWSNDTAYEYVFAEQLVTMIEAGDLVIGISCSGNSLNVINAVLLAQRYQAQTIGLLGSAGGKLKQLVDAYILAPGQNIEQEEDLHLMLAHIITCHMRSVVRGQSPARISTIVESREQVSALNNVLPR